MAWLFDISGWSRFDLAIDNLGVPVDIIDDKINLRLKKDVD